jgi:hypothetical protein
MDPNIEASLIGVGGAAGVGCLAWFCKRFLRWPFGESGLPDARATAHVGNRLNRIESDVSILKGSVVAMDGKFDEVRRERERGERHILDAISDHAAASAEAMGGLREDIGNLWGLLGKRPAKRPSPRRRSRPNPGTAK